MLFENKTQHQSELGISKAIAQGLSQHVSSPDFTAMMREQNVPHPFDSHPSLVDRMRNVEYWVRDMDYAALATVIPAESWVDLMPLAAEIEQSLWQQYEDNFSSAHELSLAWSYLPEGEEETALVLKYFPPVSWTLKDSSQVEITYQGIVDPGNGELLPWDNIKNINVIRRFGTEIVYLQHVQPNSAGKKRSVIRLPGLKKDIEIFKYSLSSYWQRNQTMRLLQQQEQALADQS